MECEEVCGALMTQASDPLIVQLFPDSVLLLEILENHLPALPPLLGHLSGGPASRPTLQPQRDSLRTEVLVSIRCLPLGDCSRELWFSVFALLSYCTVP